LPVAGQSNFGPDVLRFVSCPFNRLFRLQVLLLPIQASRPGPGEEANLAFPVLYLPLLSGVVEFNGNCAGAGSGLM
jgi:hypothetical protein